MSDSISIARHIESSKTLDQLREDILSVCVRIALVIGSLGLLWNFYQGIPNFQRSCFA